MFAVRLARSTVEPVSSSTQTRLVKSQPAGGADSVTVYEPGAMLAYDWLPLPPVVVMLNDDGESPAFVV